MLEIDYEFGFQFPEWHKDAACIEHPELDWFPERGGSCKDARAVCQRCLVQKECLAFALGEGPQVPGLSPWK